MRTADEIKEALARLGARDNTSKVEAMIDVIENDLTDEEIEEAYYDENDPWVEQAAISARQWLDGEIEADEMH